MYQRLIYRTYRRLSGFQYWVDRRFSRAGRLALVSLGLAAVLGVDTSQTMAYQAFTFLAALFMVSTLWLFFRPFRPGLTVERSLPRFATAGQPVSYRLAIRNQTARPQCDLSVIEELEDPRPSWEEFRSSGPRQEKRFDALIAASRWDRLVTRRQVAVIDELAVADLAPGGEAVLRVELVPRRRGRVHFTGTTLARPDVFGLLRRLCRLGQSQSLLVLPKRYLLPRIALPGSSRYQPAGVAQASSVGQSDEFVSLRDYRPGDPLRHIHWKSVAKVDRLVVREYEDEFFVRHALILDTFADGVGQEDAFEEAVSVAASFVCTLQTQESLLDLLFVGTEAHCFTAGRGIGHVDRMLEILAGVDLCRAKPMETLESLVLRHAAQVSGCVCVFLAWDEPRQQLVRRLRSRGVPLRVCVVTADPAPKPLPFGPMSDQPQHFHHLQAGKIQEALSQW